MLSLRPRPDTELHSQHRLPHIPTKHIHCEIIKQVRDYLKQLNHINQKHLTWIIFVMFLIQSIDYRQQSYIHVHHTTLNKETTVHHTVIGNICIKRVISIFLCILICGIRIGRKRCYICYFCFPNVISINFWDVISCDIWIS